MTREEEDQRHLRLCELDGLRSELMAEREKLETERARSRHFEREAVLRASTVAGSLLSEVLAAQRLATAVERHLQLTSGETSNAVADLRDALRFFREVDRKAGRSGADA